MLFVWKKICHFHRNIIYLKFCFWIYFVWWLSPPSPIYTFLNRCLIRINSIFSIISLTSSRWCSFFPIQAIVATVVCLLLQLLEHIRTGPHTIRANYATARWRAGRDISIRRSLRLLIFEHINIILHTGHFEDALFTITVARKTRVAGKRMR